MEQNTIGGGNTGKSAKSGSLKKEFESRGISHIQQARELYPLYLDKLRNGKKTKADIDESLEEHIRFFLVKKKKSGDFGTEFEKYCLWSIANWMNKLEFEGIAHVVPVPSFSVKLPIHLRQPINQKTAELVKFEEIKRTLRSKKAIHSLMLERAKSLESNRKRLLKNGQSGSLNSGDVRYQSTLDYALQKVDALSKLSGDPLFAWTKNSAEHSEIDIAVLVIPISQPEVISPLEFPGAEPIQVTQTTLFLFECCLFPSRAIDKEGQLLKNVCLIEHIPSVKEDLLDKMIEIAPEISDKIATAFDKMVICPIVLLVNMKLGIDYEAIRKQRAEFQFTLHTDKVKAMNIKRLDKNNTYDRLGNGVFDCLLINGFPINDTELLEIKRESDLKQLNSWKQQKSNKSDSDRNRNEPDPEEEISPIPIDVNLLLKPDNIPPEQSFQKAHSEFSLETESPLKKTETKSDQMPSKSSSL